MAENSATFSSGVADMDHEIGIEAIGVALGSTKIDNIQRGISLGREESFTRRRIGFLDIYREESADPALCLANAAIDNLATKAIFAEHDIGLLICVGQAVLNSRIPHLSALLHASLGLSKHCQTFDIGVGCSGWVQAVVSASSLMASLKLEAALVVTSDPYSLILDASDDATELIFSDGAAATLLTRTPKIGILGSDFGIESSRTNALRVDQNGKLRMDGRAVLDFAVKNVPESIDRTVKASNLIPAQVGQVFLHQGSRVVVEMLAARLPQYPTPEFSELLGNSVSSTIPILLDRVGLRESYAVACGFGVGLSWATVVLSNLGSNDGNSTTTDQKNPGRNPA